MGDLWAERSRCGNRALRLRLNNGRFRGCHQRACSEIPNYPKTMNPQNPEEWWAERCAHIAELMKNTGVAELVIRRKADGKYAFELTPESQTDEEKTDSN